MLSSALVLLVLGAVIAARFERVRGRTGFGSADVGLIGFFGRHLIPPANKIHEAIRRTAEEGERRGGVASGSC